MRHQVIEKQIADLTSALGDATRRAIFIAVRESPEPLTVGKVAELFGIHRNLARHHMERLTGDGFLQIGARPVAPARKAGRPPKHYEATTRHIEITYPTLRYDLLVELLTKILSRLSPEDLSEVAEEVGKEYGLELAEEIGTPADAGYEEAIRGVMGAMGGIGFAMNPDWEAGHLLTYHCPFGEAAVSHPEVVCSLDRGIVSGLFEAIAMCSETVLHPHVDQLEDCVTEIPVEITIRS
ncbi:MAG: helix-turn-helix domain-containing protein [bacterium]|nr:helix-turn-helix domain-containing protein [Acidimicrobiia bacterium]MCY4649979.1 helix-turn-helix domain-containing protein [bacterium]